MIFRNVRYFLPSSLTAQRRDDLSKVLNANGGEETSLEDATHVITNSHVFEGYQSVSDDVVVVKDNWVDRSVLLGKSQNAKIYSADPIMIFSGVTACTSEIAASDQEVIAAGLNGLGGLFREAFTRDCTHLIVPRTGSDKYDAAIQHKDTMQVRAVVPQWFDDCFQQMMHLPEDPYEWPEPEILRCSSHVDGDPAKKKCVIPKPRRDLIRTALVTLPEKDEELRVDKALAVIAPNVWEGRKILLSQNLELERVLESVKVSIRRGGGVLLELDTSQDEDDVDDEELAKVSEADIYITQFRAGRAYLKALEEQKTIGSLAWLFHVQRVGTIVRPEDHLLHYPRRSQSIPGFDQHVLTISNYSDDARAYLKRLITLMGGRFTPDMNQQNTVIVAAFIQGKKTEKAREWDIAIVNHTWLEDCFVAWRNITPAQEKYIMFPQGLSFAEIVAQRGVGRIGFDVGSAQEIAAIEAQIQEAEHAKRRRRREKKQRAREAEREAVEETRTDEEERAVRPVKSPKKGTEASQKEAMEVEVLMDLDDAPLANVDDDEVQEIEPELEPERERSLTPSLPVAPSKKRGRPTNKTTSKKMLLSDDEEEEESQPRRVSRTKTNERKKGIPESTKAQSTRAARSETEPEEEQEEEHAYSESPKEKKKRGRSSKTRTRSPSLVEDEEEEEEPEVVMEKPTAKQTKSKPAQSSAQDKGKDKGKGKSSPSKASSRQDVITIDSDTEPESEPYPTRRQTRSLTRSPVKAAQAPTTTKVSTSSFYAPSPKKPAAAANGGASSAQNVSKQKKATTSSRLDEIMRDLPSSDSEPDAKRLSPLKPAAAKAKAKEKAHPPSSSPLSSPGKATSVRALTDDEEDVGATEDERARKRSKEVHSPHVITRVGPPKGKTKIKAKATITATKKGPIATSTPKKALPRRRAAESDADDDEVTTYPGPEPNHIMEVEIESQESPPVAGPSRLTAAVASEMPATPSRGRPSKKRPRSPSPSRSPTPPPLPAVSKGKPKKNANAQAVTKSVTPSSIEPQEVTSATTGRPPGRQAKALAVQKLKDDVSDANKFQKEKKSGKIRGSWEDDRKGSISDKGKGKAKATESGSAKRRASVASSSAVEEVNEEDTRGRKRKANEDVDTKGGNKKKARFELVKENADVGESQESRLSDDGPPGSHIKFVTTGVVLDDKTREGLLKLGMKEAKKATDCTHLMVKSIMRTEKFLLALANGPFIITKEWASQCVKMKRVVPPEDYSLHDPEGEKKHGINLETTLKKARFQKGKLFKNHTFFLTSNVTNYPTVRVVILAHGGKVNTSKPTAEKINGDKDSRHVISCGEDKLIWRQLAEEGYPIFSTEAIYTAVLRHEMNWSDKTNQLEL